MKRFWAKVNKTETCWLWTAGTMRKGYGSFWINGGNRSAHHVAWELLVGPIPEGASIFHDCGNHLCVRPEHLRAVVDSIEDRFWEKVDKRGPDDCWLWVGVLHQGYGVLRRAPKGKLLAHRLSYEINVGPIPDGLVIDHLCMVTRCVNPTHLEPVTLSENTSRYLAVRHGKTTPRVVAR